MILAPLLLCAAGVPANEDGRRDQRPALGMSTPRDYPHSHRERDPANDTRARPPLSQRRDPGSFRERRHDAYRDGYRDGYRDRTRDRYGIRGGQSSQGYRYPYGGNTYRRPDPYQPYGHAPGYNGTPRFDYPSLRRGPSVPPPLRRYPEQR